MIAWPKKIIITINLDFRQFSYPRRAPGYPSSVLTWSLGLFTIYRKIGKSNLKRRRNNPYSQQWSSKRSISVFDFCLVCLFDCCPNHDRYMASFTINAILGQSLPRMDKTRDPERDMVPNELVADAFRAGLLSLLISSYPLLAKCSFLLVQNLRHHKVGWWGLPTTI